MEIRKLTNLMADERRCFRILVDINNKGQKVMKSSTVRSKMEPYIDGWSYI